MERSDAATPDGFRAALDAFCKAETMGVECKTSLWMGRGAGCEVLSRSV